ncbi:hypothetical protein K440DRAFT_592783 [Wilcoxina mikolae CBS 423.85]|nr:hypothetical protein K440DRAFT_592783 [Wilcoxina mikolae CBS 423.85]
MSGITDLGTTRSNQTGVGARHDTGFPEPFSQDRNTTLPHPEAATRPHEELPESILEASKRHRASRMIPGKHHKSHKDVEREMYSGLETVDADDADGSRNWSDTGDDNKHHHEGKVKRALHKLSCGTV